MRILLAEDDARLAETVAAYLRRAGFAVDIVDDGRSTLVEAAITVYDVIILDLNLPDGDGVEVCRRLRARGIASRILMATARDAVRDRVAGLGSGADDYLVKPYALEELRERVRALLRRPMHVMPEILQAGDLALDTATRVARRGGRTIALTTKEFAVLEYLMRNTGKVTTREQISEHAWDANYDPASNIIDVYVARLRRKIDAPGEESLLETIRGAGYRLGQSDR
jgi:two-component system copper resistance phosphate regulon response regulator CusR